MTYEQLRQKFPNASDDFLASNALGSAEEKSSAGPNEAPRVKLVDRPATDEGRLNKLERRWLAVLRALKVRGLEIQSITLKLADDTRYTPDMTGIGKNGELVAWEVKGFMRDDAHVKIKVAARRYPYIRFVLVTWDSKLKRWNQNDVKP